MERLKLENPGTEQIQSWEKEFQNQIEEQSKWIGEPDINYSVELHVLDGTYTPKSENVERLRDKVSEPVLYAFFVDAERDTVNNQDWVFDEKLQELNQRFNGSSLPMDKAAYLNSLYDLVPDVEHTEQYSTDAVLSGISENLEMAYEIEQEMKNSEDYNPIYAELNAGQVSNSMLGAYQGVLLNCSIDVGFLYSGEGVERGESDIPGKVAVDGDNTKVDLRINDDDFDISSVENWIDEMK